MKKNKSEIEIYQTEDGFIKIDVHLIDDTVWLSQDQMSFLFQREKSIRGTQFRQWATKRLNEYIRKGFTLDDERLKNGRGR